MEMKPYSRKTRNHGRSSAQYTNPQGPPYYTPLDYTAAIYPSPPYPPPTAAAYYPPPPQPPYFGYPADKRTVEEMVRKQIEYYLSEENLIKDVFLRKYKMDQDGYVLLSEIAQFQRVASLTQDMDTVVSALKESETIEICDGVKIRPKKDPLRWPFPTSVLQYLPQPQAPQISQKPPLIQPRTEQHATRLLTQPQQHHHQNQNQQQPQQHQPITSAPAVVPIQDQPEPDLPLPQKPLSQQQNQKQPQPGPTQSDASSPNNSSSSDISSGTNNDNISRLSLTYATAVTNKPTTNGHNHHQPQPQQQQQQQKQNQSQQHKQNQSQQQKQNQSHQQPIGDIPNKHNKSSTPVESEWKEVKSRRRRPGKA